MSRDDRGRSFVTWGGDGALQMGWDAALLEAAEEGRAGATLRFSTWTPAAVSIGRFQDVARAVDVERARAAGFDVVRRPTGGRAVLHDGDLVYTLVARRDDPAFGGTREASLRAIAEALAAGLAALGVACELAEGRPAPWPDRGAAAQPCFASASRDEIRAGSRKLIGSARVEGRAAFLQHGSLALTRRPERLADLAPIPIASRAALSLRLAAASASLDAIAGRSVGAAEAVRALRTGFEARADRAFPEESLTAADARRARALSAALSIARAATSFAAASASPLASPLSASA